MQTTSVFAVPAHVSFAEVTDEAVILDMEREVFFGINEVGTVVWKRIMSEPPATLCDLVEAVAAVFDAGREAIESDVGRFVVDLQARGLVQVA